MKSFNGTNLWRWGRAGAELLALSTVARASVAARLDAFGDAARDLPLHADAGPLAAAGGVVAEF
jgi:hypothetical protein